MDEFCYLVLFMVELKNILIDQVDYTKFEWLKSSYLSKIKFLLSTS